MCAVPTAPAGIQRATVGIGTHAVGDRAFKLLMLDVLARCESPRRPRRAAGRPHLARLACSMPTWGAMRQPLAVAVACAAILLATPACAQISGGPHVRVLHQDAVAEGAFFLYSPGTGPRSRDGAHRLWLGGWSTAADMPRDRIFTGSISQGRLGPRLTEVLALPGALVNDPAVIAVPGRPGLRMYFTVLSLDDVDRAVERNVVWTATSLDGGLTWQNAREAIGQSNGVNACGAWSPSVLVERALVCVYYHGNSPCLGVYRTCFRLDGVTPAGRTEELELPFELANVDVVRAGRRYVMVGDALGLPDLLEIRALESADGRTWQPLRGTGDGLLVRADSGIVFTPHIADVSDDGVTVMFASRSSLELAGEGNVLHRWTLQTPGPGWTTAIEPDTEGVEPPGPDAPLRDVDTRDVSPEVPDAQVVEVPPPHAEARAALSAAGAPQHDADSDFERGTELPDGDVADGHAAPAGMLDARAAQEPARPSPGCADEAPRAHGESEPFDLTPDHIVAAAPLASRRSRAEHGAAEQSNDDAGGTGSTGHPDRDGELVLPGSSGVATGPGGAVCERSTWTGS